jgi:RecA-family ATPase
VTESSYPWGEPFQLRLLALLLQQPEKVSGLVEAQFFTSPMLVDIARVLQETHRKYPGSRVSRATLGELVRQTLGRKEDEYWPSYKAQIKRIFRTALTDTPWLLEQAKQFAKETRYRAALVESERYIGAGKYEAVHKTIERLQSFDSPDGVQWRNLPKYDDFPPRKVEWLVEGLVPAESIIALSGDEGVGKTIFALWLARSLTEGTDFLGRRVIQTPVLYLCPDVSQINLQSYVGAMRWEPNKGFRIMAMWTGDEMQPPMLDDPAQVERLYTLAEEKHPFIIVDTLRDLFAGEENSSTDTKPVMDAVRKARAKGATIMFTSHPPKGGGSIIRGTGNIPQKVDIPY